MAEQVEAEAPVAGGERADRDVDPGQAHGPDGRFPTINDLAQQLFIRHNSAVGLVDRLGEKGLVVRARDRVDRRKVGIRLTARGGRVLAALADVHREELQRLAPVLDGILREIVAAT